MSGSPTPSPAVLRGDRLVGTIIGRAALYLVNYTPLVDPADITFPVDDTVFELRFQMNSADFTPTTAPFVNATVTEDGRLLLVRCAALSAFNLIITDDGTLPGSKLRLSATTHVLTPGSSVLLRWDVTVGMWCEIAKTILV